eukprot:m.197834 g.197834  ORF g.197834 m.197834 type:complete len:159 (-) comp10649_c0_seq13:1219-1695(-)
MNNGTLLHLLRTSQQNNPVVLTKPCETRFGSNVQMLLRIVRLKDVVRALFVSQTFSDARDALPPNKKLVANRCRENCLDDAFWAHIDLALEVLAPAYALLRTVDTPAAAISEVWVAYSAKNHGARCSDAFGRSTFGCSDFSSASKNSLIRAKSVMSSR